MKYKPYPKYKDSGIPWLGQLPEHWVINSVKHLTHFQVGWTPATNKDENFIGDNLWANISDIKGKFIDNTNKKISDNAAKSVSMGITPKNSLLYSFKLSVGLVSFANRDMYTNEAIASFLATSKLPLDYLYYALPIFVIKNASTNIYDARILNQELIKNAILIELTYDEAKRIAYFLDHEIDKIDTLISKQYKLIELLKEKRQAVIDKAVTKGLDDSVPMKDSGVEWLGDVPEHWGIEKLKYELRLCTVKLNVENHFVIALENIESKTGKHVDSDSKYQGDGISFAEGDILFGKLRPYLSKVFKACRSGVAFGDILVYRPEKNIINDYAFYLLLNRSFINIIDSSTYGSKMPRASYEFINEMMIPIPRVNEQLAITNYLNQYISKFDKLIIKSEKSIELLKEKRTALISATVTGKIDVRDYEVK